MARACCCSVRLLALLFELVRLALSAPPVQLRKLAS
jgi:hypothetical protein